MVKSGITRRIDELGRIVIPKEIRKNLKIHDNDEIDIIFNNDTIILSKHELEDDDVIIHHLLTIINKYLNKSVLYTSRDKIINYVLLNKEKIDNNELNSDIMNIIEKRKVVTNIDYNISLFNNKKINYIICPLVINGDLLGSLILYSQDIIVDKDKNILLFAKMFLEKYLE